VRFLEAVECVGRFGILGLVWMDEEGFLAVGFYDVGFGDARLQVQDRVGVEAELI
jgi:hypothetical protein